MKLDDLFCFDCALMRASLGVGCIKHTPMHLRGARELRIREATRMTAQMMIAAGGRA